MLCNPNRVAAPKHSHSIGHVDLPLEAPLSTSSCPFGNDDKSHSHGNEGMLPFCPKAPTASESSGSSVPSARPSFDRCEAESTTGLLTKASAAGIYPGSLSSKPCFCTSARPGTFMPENRITSRCSTTSRTPSCADPTRTRRKPSPSMLVAKMLRCSPAVSGTWSSLSCQESHRRTWSSGLAVAHETTDTNLPPSLFVVFKAYLGGV